MNDQPEITVYGTNWPPDCGRAKRLLDGRQIPYRWVDLDKDRGGEKSVIATNRGNRSVPTIVLAIVRIWWNHPITSCPKNFSRPT